MDDDESANGGKLRMTIKELKSLFWRKKNYCKLDYYFSYWDIKLGKYKRLYE